MRVVVIGSGYVGLVSGVCFSEFGFNVTCVDKDAGKIERLTKGEVPIYEPGLDALMHKNMQAGRLNFTLDFKGAVAQADVVFIAVGTPTRRGDGHADLTYVYAAAKEIAESVQGYTVVVNKSTVPVGTAKEVSRIIKETNPSADVDVVSNPEFLREGAAINDFMRPDRVVVGLTTDRAKKLMANLYRPLHLIETPILFTTPETSELIKYAANSFLAVKISFINEIADLCEKVGADVQQVAKGMGLDGRIGGKFLHAGPGYGGSCFPKDTLALVKIGEAAGSPIRLVETTVKVNDDRKKAMADRVIHALGGSVKGKTIGVLGVAFKPETDDMRDAPSLTILPLLQQAGATIRAYDPAAMHEAEKLIPNITWSENAYDALKGADVALLLTEWNEFRSLDLARVKELLTQPLMVDLRNVYKPAEMAKEGFIYHSIGRAPVK